MAAADLVVTGTVLTVEAHGHPLMEALALPDAMTRTAPSGRTAGLEVRVTYLAGRQVYHP